MNNKERVEQIANLIIKGNSQNVFSKTIKVFGYQYNYYQELYGELNLYGFYDLDIKEYLAPLNIDSANHNRPGIKKDQTLYICVHDTASAAKTANALAHAKYVSNGGDGTSWHYSCGDDGVYHQIPDDEVAYHAGDGTSVSLKYTDTLVKATTINPKIEIIDNYLYFNGEKSIIKAPTLEIKNDNGTLKYYSEGAFQVGKVNTDKEEEIILNLTTASINDAGLKTIIGENGNYFLAPIYYNHTYKYVCNRLGNLGSIGIETMVNEGSNILRTWHNCAKLVAKLLIENNLNIQDVKPHHYFSGKQCPNTMRNANEWQHFLNMVEMEYEIRKLMTTDTKIILKSDINVPDGIFNEKVKPGKYSYQVIISSGDITKVVDLVTVVN